MEANGLTKRFPGAVAHGIHSITLEDIRHYFKSNATEENNVPTLNYDLKDPSTVLPHAKLYGYDTSFFTIGMRQLDQVMRDMDKKDWYLTNYNTLERLVHTIHMNEVWAKAKVHYDSISLQNIGEDVCACVKDTKHNGILKMLPFLALKIRYPGITSGKTLKIKGGEADFYQSGGNLYTYHFINEWSKKLENIDFGNNIEEIKKEVSTNLADGDEGMHHLENENDWKKWKSGMKEMVEHDDYELAMFLYCTLRD